MEIRKVKEGFEKGGVVIVRRYNGKTYKTDLTVLHTAYCLSENVYFLDKLDISLDALGEKEIIYICGHGKEKDIGGWKMEDIAKVLVKQGYKGKQNIYITSCYSSKVNASKLEEEILKCLEEKYRGYKKSFMVESRVNGASITVKRDNGKVEQYDVTEEDKYSERCNMKYTLKMYLQRYLFSFLPENKKMEKINKYKSELVRGLENNKRRE